MNPALPLSRQLSRDLDDYRPRIAELGDSKTYWRVLDELSRSSLPRGERWMFAAAALFESRKLIDGPAFYDVTPSLQKIEAEVAAKGTLTGGTHTYLAYRSMGWAHAAFEHEGRNIYEVSNGLAEKLAHTELRGLTVAEVRLPFRSIYVVAPPGSGLTLPDGRPIAGAYLTECLSNLRQSEGTRLLVTDVHAAAATSEGLGKAFNGAVSLRVAMPPDDSLENCLAYRWTPNSASVAADTRAQAFMRDTAPGVWRWLLNVVLYLTMPGARVEPREANRDRAALEDRIAKLPPGEKRERLKLRLKSVPSDRRIYLGSGVTCVTAKASKPVDVVQVAPAISR